MYSRLFVLLAVGVGFGLPFPAESDAGKPVTLVSGGKCSVLVMPEQLRSSRSGLIGSSYRWPNATIPYEIDDGSYTPEEANLIQSTIESFNEKTCVTVREATPDDAAYVLISKGEGCVAYIGIMPLPLQPQDLGIENGEEYSCLDEKNIVKMLFYTWGFLGEDISERRADYLEIVWENVRDTSCFPTLDDTVVTDFGCGFDLDSVTLDSHTCSKNGLPTLRALSDPDRKIGGDDLSELDIKKLNCMYAGYNSRCTCDC